MQDRFKSDIAKTLLGLPPPNAEQDPVYLRRKISSRIMKLPGVSGVGVPKGRLTVYLEYDSEETRTRVREFLKEVSPDTDPLFMVTGKFYKREK